MTELLYCIEHEEMVAPYQSPYADLSHTFWEKGDHAPFKDMMYCDFDQGWATCPPPEFDLDEYIRREGQPPAVISEDFKAYDYDVESDQIVVEIFP